MDIVELLLLVVTSVMTVTISGGLLCLEVITLLGYCYTCGSPV